MTIEMNHHANLHDCIHSLWIGNRLDTIELLTIASFLKNNHRFVLWIYDNLENELPEDLIIQDAKLIISKDKIFKYKYSDQFGHGKGSYAGFSDIFRYKLLYLYGGWWVDMDVTCMKPLNFQAPYVFRPHHDMPVVGNVMKCPKGSPLMKYCFERATAEVNENNRDWHLPIQILNDGIDKFNLSGYILDFANPESWYENRKMITGNIEIPDKWYVIHWINEEWRRSGIDKNYSGGKSVLRQLMTRYAIPVNSISFFRKIYNRCRLSLPFLFNVRSPEAFRYTMAATFRIIVQRIKSDCNRIYWLFIKPWFKLKDRIRRQIFSCRGKN